MILRSVSLSSDDGTSRVPSSSTRLRLVPTPRRLSDAKPAPPLFTALLAPGDTPRSEEHTSELQSLMRISYAVFCLKKTTKNHTRHTDLKTVRDKQIQQNTNTHT